jgi:glyceraldehyde-3-phosphate dehydrogenase (NAD(P))
MIKVGLNGYGTIGKRIAHGVSLQDDMTVTGIVKTRPDYIAKIASRSFNIYVPDESRIADFEDNGIKIKGTLENLMEDSDVIVDATPEKVGAQNKEIYLGKKIKAIFQGGEKETIAQTSFNAYSNFSESIDKDYVRVVSCNTTGLARTLYPLKEKLGLKRVNATLIRRATDPFDSKKGPINAIEPSLKFPSHHAPDLKTVISDIEVETVAIKVPTTLMHVHVVQAELGKETNTENILEILSNYNRVMQISGKDGIVTTSQVMEMSRELGRNRSDLYEIAVWNESVTVSGSKVNYIQAVHQESDVIPENIDAIRSTFNMMEKEKSIEKTDQSLGIGRKV